MIQSFTNTFPSLFVKIIFYRECISWKTLKPSGNSFFYATFDFVHSYFRTFFSVTNNHRQKFLLQKLNYFIYFVDSFFQMLQLFLCENPLAVAISFLPKTFKSF